MTQYCQSTNQQWLYIYNGGGYGHSIGAKFTSGNSATGETITSATWNLKKLGSPTGTCYCYIGTSSSNTLLGEVDVSTISSSASDVTFDSASNSHVLATDDSCWIIYQTGGDISNRVDVGATNTGNNPNANLEGYSGNSQPPTTAMNKQPTFCVLWGSTPPPPPSSSGTRLPPPPIVVNF